MQMTWFSAKVEKRFSAIHGRGLFAVQPIEADEIVIVKGGSDPCRGVIIGRDWQRPDIQRRYDGYFSWFIQRRIGR